MWQDEELVGYEDLLFEESRERDDFDNIFQPLKDVTPRAKQFAVAFLAGFYLMSEREIRHEFAIRGISLSEHDIILGLSQIK